MTHQFNSILAAAAGALALGAVANAQTVLAGGTLIDGNGGAAIPFSMVVIEDGRITCAGASQDCMDAAPEGATIVDVSGAFITPGLVDGHVHYGQTGWLDGRPDGIEARDVYPYPETVAALRADPGRWPRAFLCSGVTAVIDTGGQDWTVTDAPGADSAGPDGVRRIAAGPLITHASARNRVFAWGELEDQLLFLPMDSDEAALAGVAHLQEIGADAVKVWFLDPPEGEREILEARLMLVGEAADAAGLPLWVHATELANAKSALRAGAEMLVHSVEDAPVDAEFIDLLLANDAVYAPTLVVGENWSRALAAVALGAVPEIEDPNNCVDDAMRERIAHPERFAEAAPQWLDAAWALSEMESVGRSNAQMDANLRAVHTAGGRIIVATDAGNPLTLHGPSIYEEMERMQAAGIPTDALIVMATRAGAAAMGLADEIGAIEAGKAADLLVLAEDPREDIAAFRSLTHVMKAGVLHTQAELQVR
ncbi:MAG: amidohydrolase family protein [Oceanicaulis sp.]